MGTDGVRLLIDGSVEARAALAAELESHPEWPDLHLRQGVAHYLDGAFDQAVEWFERALALNHRYVAALSALGHAALKDGRPEDARWAFEREKSVAPTAGWPSIDLALLGIATGSREDAAAALADARRRLADHPIVFRTRALLELSCDDDEAAAAALRAGARRSALFAEELGVAGVLAGRRYDPDAARRYAGAVERCRAAADWFDYVGGVCAARQAFEEAAGWYGRAVTVAYDLDAYYAATGQLLSAQGREQDALEHYALAITQAPDAVRVRIACGYEYARQGDVRQAIAHFAAARDLRPGWADVHFNLGLLYYDTGDLDRAVESYLAALQINPSYAIARNALAFTLLRRGDALLAQAEYRRTLASGLTSADILVNMGRIHLQNGELNKALRVLEEASQVNPDYAPAHYHLGHAYQQLGQPRRARSAWRRFLRAAKDTDQAVPELVRSATA